MKPKRRCSNCGRGKHSLCAGLSQTADGAERPCSCCGDLSGEERGKKEREGKEEKAQQQYERSYNRYGDDFDLFLRRKRKDLGKEPNASPISFLPKDEKEMAVWVSESGVPKKWLKLFLAEYRQDNPLSGVE